MTGLAARLYEKISQMWVIDTHEHMRPETERVSALPGRLGHLSLPQGRLNSPA